MSAINLANKDYYFSVYVLKQLMFKYIFLKNITRNRALCL